MYNLTIILRESSIRAQCRQTFIQIFVLPFFQHLWCFNCLVCLKERRNFLIEETATRVNLKENGCELNCFATEILAFQNTFWLWWLIQRKERMCCHPVKTTARNHLRLKSIQGQDKIYFYQISSCLNDISSDAYLLFVINCRMTQFLYSMRDKLENILVCPTLDVHAIFCLKVGTFCK